MKKFYLSRNIIVLGVLALMWLGLLEWYWAILIIIFIADMEIEYK